MEEAELSEVGILGNDGEVMLACVIPNSRVGGSLETYLPNVDRAREYVSQGFDQAMGKVGI